MTRYAEGTEVSSERTRAEIERTLTRYGAQSFVYGWDRQFKFMLPLPDKQADEFALTPSGRYQRTASAQMEAWERAVRQRWRALALVIKAKLEAVESGITTLEDEFLAHIVLPGGTTVGQQIRPAIAAAY